MKHPTDGLGQEQADSKTYTCYTARDADRFTDIQSKIHIEMQTDLQ